MKYDLFEFHPDMTASQIAWRLALLIVAVGTLALDLFFWRA
jgi:hypothetical protein